MRFPGLCLALSLSALTGSAAAQVPAEFVGDWVPTLGTCQAAARLRVAESQLTLINGRDSKVFGDIGIPTTFFGPDYNGISVVVMPEINSGESPFTVFFNADEEKGMTRVEIYREIKGNTNAAVRAIQARAQALARRFPVNMMPLKKCRSN